MQGLWVRSLVEELRSHMLLGQKTKTWDRKNIITNSIKTLKMVHIKKKKKGTQKKLGVLNPTASGNWILPTVNLEGRFFSSEAFRWLKPQMSPWLQIVRELEANDPVKPTQMPHPQKLWHSKCFKLLHFGGQSVPQQQMTNTNVPPKLVPAHPLDFISQNSVLIHNTPGIPALLKPPRPLRHILSLGHSQRLFHLPEMPSSLQDLS